MDSPASCSTGERRHPIPFILLYRQAWSSIPGLERSADLLVIPSYPSRRLSLLSPRSPPSSPQSRRPPSTLRRRSPRPQRLRLALSRATLSPHPMRPAQPRSIRGLDAPPLRRLGFHRRPGRRAVPLLRLTSSPSASVSSRTSSLILAHVTWWRVSEPRAGARPVAGLCHSNTLAALPR
jgi:hypothetical protein